MNGSENGSAVKNELWYKRAELLLSLLALGISVFALACPYLDKRDSQRLILKGIPTSLYGDNDAMELSPVDPEMHIDKVFGIAPTKISIPDKSGNDRLDTESIRDRLRCGMNFRILNGPLEEDYLIKIPLPMKEEGKLYPPILGDVPVVMIAEYDYKGSNKQTIRALYYANFTYRPLLDGKKGNTLFTGISFKRFLQESDNLQAIVDAEFALQEYRYR
jgi:hypothetical protein